MWLSMSRWTYAQGRYNHANWTDETLQFLIVKLLLLRGKEHEEQTTEDKRDLEKMLLAMECGRVYSHRIDDLLSIEIIRYEDQGETL